MNIHISRQSEELLREQMARGEFRSPEEVIERALKVLADQRTRTTFREQKPNEFAGFLDALAAYSDKIPSMPGETFPREMIYQDHE